MHRFIVKHQAADALSRALTAGEDRIDLNDALSVLTIVPADKEKEAKGINERHIVVNEALNDIVPELLAVSKMAMTSTPFNEPTTAELLIEQSKDLLCRQRASTVGAPGSYCSYNRSGFLICVALPLSMERYRESFHDRYRRCFYTPNTTRD